MGGMGWMIRHYGKKASQQAHWRYCFQIWRLVSNLHASFRHERSRVVLVLIQLGFRFRFRMSLLSLTRDIFGGCPSNHPSSAGTCCCGKLRILLSSYAFLASRTCLCRYQSNAISALMTMTTATKANTVIHTGLEELDKGGVVDVIDCA
jgi:hypothetical protein